MAILIAWLNAIIPILAVTGAYLIAISQGYSEVCNPFVTGCTSISRAARYQDALFWFRGLMLPITSLLAIYWVYQYRWLKQFGDKFLRYKIILAVGMGSALALTFYANFLGSEGEVYRFMRRSGIMFYFGLAMLAQLLSIQSMYQSNKILSKPISRLLRWQMFLVSGQWLIGLVSLAVIFAQSEMKYTVNNILEWNYALLMTGFYMVSGMIWQRENFRPSM